MPITQNFSNQSITEENITSDAVITLPTREEYLNSFNYTRLLTREMAEFSYDRTKRHQKRVLENIKLILQQPDIKECLNLSEDEFENFKEQMIARGKKHDLTKLFPPEDEAYVYINWRSQEIGFFYPCSVTEIITNAIHHHWQVNPHHPEFYFIKEDGQLEADKRIIKEKLKSMSDADLTEMISDWTAMSQEYNNSLYEFANNNIGSEKRWPFSSDKKNKIFKLIEITELAHQIENVTSLQQEETNLTNSPIESIASTYQAVQENYSYDHLLSNQFAIQQDYASYQRNLIKETGLVPIASKASANNINNLLAMSTSIFILFRHIPVIYQVGKNIYNDLTRVNRFIRNSFFKSNIESIDKDQTVEQGAHCESNSGLKSPR